jgi:hypothetical protein
MIYPFTNFHGHHVGTVDKLQITKIGRSPMACVHTEFRENRSINQCPLIFMSEDTRMDRQTDTGTQEELCSFKTLTNYIFRCWPKPLNTVRNTIRPKVIKKFAAYIS